MAEQQLPSIFIAGEERKLGTLLRTSPIGSVFAEFRKRFKAIPRSEWKPVSYIHLSPGIRDQDGIGACNAFAACMATRYARIAVGKTDLALSEGCLYGQINGGRDQGSMLGDALVALRDVGTPTDDVIGPLAWQKSKWPADWQAKAKGKQINEAFDCPAFGDLASAIQLGFFVDYGIMVGNGFATGSDGWVKYERGGGGHAMAGVGLAVKDNKWGIITQNSWGTAWGGGGDMPPGFGIVPEQYFTGTFTDGWAVRTVIQETTDQFTPGK